MFHNKGEQSPEICMTNQKKREGTQASFGLYVINNKTIISTLGSQFTPVQQLGLNLSNHTPNTQNQLKSQGSTHTTQNNLILQGIN